MMPIPLLALALALVGAVCLVLLIWNRRWLELAIVLLAGGALALYLEHGRRGPDRIGALVAEVVNADRSISLHVRAEPGTPVWCSSVFSVESAPAGEPARDSADWRVDLYPTERSDAKPLDADAAGRAVVTLPAPLVESAPNRAVHVWFNGTDNGTTRLEPPAEFSGRVVVFEECDETVTSNLYVGMLRDEVVRRLGEPDKIEVWPASNLVHWAKFPAGTPSPTGDVVVLTFDNGSARIGGETLVFLQRGSNSVEEVIGDVEIPPGVVL